MEITNKKYELTIRLINFKIILLLVDSQNTLTPPKYPMSK